MENDEFLPSLADSFSTKEAEALKKARHDQRMAELAEEEKRQAAWAEEIARKTPFARVPLWVFYLGVTRLECEIIGRIYSFQCTGGEYRLSLKNGAIELKTDRDDLQTHLSKLVGLGFLNKKSNGQRKPATYKVCVPECIETAIYNGWDPSPYSS